MLTIWLIYFAGALAMFANRLIAFSSWEAETIREVCDETGIPYTRSTIVKFAVIDGMFWFVLPFILFFSKRGVKE